MAVSADGTRAVTGSHDGNVRLWDVAYGQQIDQWDGDSEITSIGGSQQLLRIAAGDATGQVHILDLEDELAGPATAAHTADQTPARDRSPRSKRRSIADILGFGDDLPDHPPPRTCPHPPFAKAAPKSQASPPDSMSGMMTRCPTSVRNDLLLPPSFQAAKAGCGWEAVVGRYYRWRGRPIIRSCHFPDVGGRQTWGIRP